MVTCQGTLRRLRRSLWLSAIAPLGLTVGCTFGAGEFFYAMGIGGKTKVEAQFALTSGPLMILIDDIHERVDVPTAPRYLFDGLSQDLLANKGAAKIVPMATVDQLRQSVPNFDKRGCREIGEMGGAEQVLWIEVTDFLAEEQIYEAGNAAYWSVTVKVINVLEKTSRSRVRLWPESPDGQALSVSLTGAMVARAKSRDAIAKELAAELAMRIGRLFYDHKVGGFSSEQ